jgi:hypothetical protein
MHSPMWLPQTAPRHLCVVCAVDVKVSGCRSPVHGGYDPLKHAGLDRLAVTAYQFVRTVHPNERTPEVVR